MAGIIATVYNILFSRFFAAFICLLTFLGFMLYDKLSTYFLFGAIAALGTSFIYFETFKKHGKKNNFEVKWFHYIPVYLLDIAIWPFALVALTGDSIKLHLLSIYKRNRNV